MLGYERALDKAESITAQLSQPDSVGSERVALLLERANAYSWADFHHLARLDFQAVLELGASPDQQADCLIGLGGLHWRRRESEIRREYYERALALEGLSADARVKAITELGCLYVQLSQEDVAKDHFLRAMEVEDAEEELRLNAELEWAGCLPLAQGREVFKRLARTRKFPNLVSNALAEFAWVQRHCGQPVRAKKNFIKAANVPGASDGEKAYALRRLGLSFVDEDPETEFFAYDEILKLTDIWPHCRADALLMRAMAYRDLDDEEGFVRDIQELIDWPGSPRYLRMSALIHRGDVAENDEEARRYWNRVIELAPEDPISEESWAVREAIQCLAELDAEED